MPYRRLPNTDLARIRSMQRIIEMEHLEATPNLAVSYKTINEIKAFMGSFQTLHNQYQASFQEQVKANKKYQAAARKSRLYLSHFIQVYSMAVIRQEIKKETKSLYGLPTDNHTVPDLVSDTALVEWGEKVIQGETERMAHGGAPIYNPTIAKVRVHYDIFKELYFSQKKFQESTTLALEKLTAKRNQADLLILEAWNQVEEYYKLLSPTLKQKRCEHYGIIYYYRKIEQERIEADKQQQKIFTDDY